MADFIMTLFNIVAALAMFGLGLIVVVMDVGFAIIIFDLLIKCPKIKKEKDKRDEM